MENTVTPAEVQAVTPPYEVLATMTNVLVKCPPFEDHNLKEIQAHTFIDHSGKKVSVAHNYRCGIFINKKMVTRYFYVDFFNLGEMIVADKVVVTKKFDPRTGEKSIIIDVHKRPSAEKLVPQYRLKTGTEKGEIEKYTLIPGTTRFIKFEEI